MKYLLILVLLFVRHDAKSQSTKPVTDTIKQTCYFFWTYNYGSRTAYGENDFQCSNKPTRAELLKWIIPLLEPKKGTERYIKISVTMYATQKDLMENHNSEEISAKGYAEYIKSNQ